MWMLFSRACTEPSVEDGTIQGLLELADIAYVGGGVLGSSAGMDKRHHEVTVSRGGLPSVKHVTVFAQSF